MKIEKDYINHSYKIEYVIGLERIIAYIDFSSTEEDIQKWLNRHKQYIRERVISILNIENQ